MNTAHGITVEQLIERLRLMPQQSEVVLVGSDPGPDGTYRDWVDPVVGVQMASVQMRDLTSTQYPPPSQERSVVTFSTIRG